MVTFGITEVLQISGSVPLAMGETALTATRMMSAMSSDREFEALAGWRFQRRPIGIGGRQESTLYVGGTVPMESRRDDVAAGPSITSARRPAMRPVPIISGWAAASSTSSRTTATGWAIPGWSRSSTATGRRPFAPRPAGPTCVSSSKPPPRIASGDTVAGADRGPGARGVFVGPTTLLVYKAVALEGGVLFPLYQREVAGSPKERLRVAVNFSYFFWLR